MRRLRAFTLVELLVVIGIIAVLVALLLPALNKAREQARCVACQSNQRQILMAIRMYSDENKGWLPVPVVGGFQDNPGRSDFAIWQSDIAQYDWNNGALWPYVSKDPLSRQRVFNCPSDDPDPRLSDISDGTPDPAHPRNFSYNFNSYLAAVQHKSTRYGIRANQICHPEHKILVVEQKGPRSTVGQVNVIAVRPEQPGAQVYPMLTNRHSGCANEGMADGHVERIDPSLFNGTKTLVGAGYDIAVTNLAYYHYYALTDPR